MHLAHGIAGQVIHENHPFGELVIREAALQRLDHILLLQIVVLGQNHDRHDAFAEILVRQADHGGFLDAGFTVDHAFDFLGIDIVAAADDEVLASADNVDIASLVDLAKIAGDEETVGTEIGLGFLRDPPVALEDVGSLDLYHARVARARGAAAL